MAWSLDNDPWRKNVTKKSHKACSLNGVADCNNKKGLKLHGDTSLLDPMAVQAAELLMSINARDTSQRQCAAANTSALFHLLMNSSCVERKPAEQGIQCLPSVDTAGKLQQLLSSHLGENYGTLVKAMQALRRHMPGPLAKRIDEVNRAASYDRHHMVYDSKLLDEAQCWLESFDFSDIEAEAESLSEESMRKPDTQTIGTIAADIGTQKPETEITNDSEAEVDKGVYAHTVAEPVRLDTGTEYIKLPFATYVRILHEEDGKMKVRRLTGSSSEVQSLGTVPSEQLKIIPMEFIPPYVLSSERFSGKHVCLKIADGLSYEDKPYFDAGPRSKRLEANDIIKVKDVHADFANVSLIDEKGAGMGFGKIRTWTLEGALEHEPVEGT